MRRRTGKGKADQEGGTKKRTGVDSKNHDRDFQDDPILVRTQDPSPPDHDTVGDNILSQIPGDSPSQGSVQGCSRTTIWLRDV